jgi:hypothetical protein
MVEQPSLGALIACWFIFMFVSFGVSVLTLCFVQIRLIQRRGWPNWPPWRTALEDYWTELSPIQRVLIYTGLVAFFLTFFAGVIGTLLRNL